MAGPGSPYFLFCFDLFTTCFFVCGGNKAYCYDTHDTDEQHCRISHNDFQGPWASYMLYIVPVNIGPFPLFHRSSTSMGSVSQYWFRYEASVLSILVMQWPACSENRVRSYALCMSWFVFLLYALRKSEVSHIQSEYRAHCNCWIVTAVFLSSKWDMDRCVI